MTQIIQERSLRGARPVTFADCDRQITDRDLQEEIQFHARRNPEPSKVRTTVQITTLAMEFAGLRKINELNRAFWAQHAEGGSL
jgi:hypothetical protein